MSGNRLQRRSLRAGGGTPRCQRPSKAKVPRPEREAKPKPGELLWQIWSRFAHLGDLMPLRDKWTVSRTTVLFDKFVITNDDLLREVESGFRTGNGVPLEILTKVERRAQRFPR
jgi:hypothetical protein